MTSPLHQPQMYGRDGSGATSWGLCRAHTSAVVNDQQQNRSADNLCLRRAGFTPHCSDITGRGFGPGTSYSPWLGSSLSSREAGALIPSRGAGQNSGVKRSIALRRPFSTELIDHVLADVSDRSHRVQVLSCSSCAGSKTASKRGHDLGKVIQPHGLFSQGSAPND